MSSKPTPGPYKVFDPNREGRSYRPIVVGRGDEHHWDEAFYIGNAARDINVIPLASLIADARNTLHETGLTPQQLREQRDELLAALKALVADTEDYERVNNLAPAPGKLHCWRSMQIARAAIASVEAAS